MAAVLTKAIAFVTIIIMGYVLKRIRFFHAKDFYLISNIVIKITLPAAIVANFSKITMDFSLLVMCVAGLCCNLVTVAVGYGACLKKTKEEKAFAMLNLSGYNIGNFTMPFVQSFLSPVGFAATSLFDAGNSVMCTGINYTLASMVVGENEKPSAVRIIKKLFSSIPFDAYVVMTILTVLKLRLPAIMISFAETVGASNAFLALLMLGIGFEIRMEREKLAQIASILIMRYGIAILLSLGFFFLTPFSLEVRQTLAIISLGPVASVAPAYTGALGGDVEMASAVNSLSIIMSVIAITAALIILL